jgi:cobaltochelatase CobS
MDSTKKINKRSRCRTCGELGIKVRDPRSGYRKLYAAIKIAGSLQPDMNAPHVCPGKPTGFDEAKVRSIVQEELLGLGAKPTTPQHPPTPHVPPSNTSAVDEAKVQAIVNSAVAALKPQVERTVIMQRTDGEQVQVEGYVHPLFPRLLRYLRSGVNVYLYGAPGGGKSHAAAQVATVLGRQYGYISLAPMTPESRIMGFLGVYVSTPFYRCYTEGGVFCIDEMDNANDALLTALNGALENKRAAFPNGVFDRHKDFVLVATGNTAGYGGTRGHAGRRAFDAATRERFAYIRWTYNEDMERGIATALFPGIGPWIEWVRSARSYCATQFPDVVVSPRASIKGASLLADGAVESSEELADALVFRGLEEAQRTRILSACPLPTFQIEAK